LRPVHTAAAAGAGEERFLEFSGAWAKKRPAIIRLWDNPWEEDTAVVGLGGVGDPADHPRHQPDRVVERPPQARRAGPRPHPEDTAALKRLYLVTRSSDPTGKTRKRWTNRSKPALNASAISFPDPPDPAQDNQKHKPHPPNSTQTLSSISGLKVTWYGHTV
jgi:transposase-like protein